MITVHHLNNSRSQRVLWLLEELGLKYEIKRYERDKKTMLAPASLRATAFGLYNAALGVGSLLASFDVAPRNKKMLLEGLDEIGLTQAMEPQIAAFQAADRVRRPWIYT